LEFEDEDETDGLIGMDTADSDIDGQEDEE